MQFRSSFNLSAGFLQGFCFLSVTKSKIFFLLNCAAKVHTFREVAMGCPDLVTSKGRTALYFNQTVFFLSFAYYKKKRSRIINLAY